jgi:hypothetical protein
LAMRECSFQLSGKPAANGRRVLRMVCMHGNDVALRQAIRENTNWPFRHHYRSWPPSRVGTLHVGNGELAEVTVQGISTDTRSLQPGDLFLALKGDRFDGHRFVSQAMAQGAAGVIVQEPVEVMPQLQVPDTLAAYQAIAQWWRQKNTDSPCGRYRFCREDHNEGTDYCCAGDSRCPCSENGGELQQ